MLGVEWGSVPVPAMQYYTMQGPLKVGQGKAHYDSGRFSVKGQPNFRPRRSFSLQSTRQKKMSVFTKVKKQLTKRGRILLHEEQARQTRLAGTRVPCPLVRPMLWNGSLFPPKPHVVPLGPRPGVCRWLPGARSSGSGCRSSTGKQGAPWLSCASPRWVFTAQMLVSFLGRLLLVRVWSSSWLHGL